MKKKFLLILLAVVSAICLAFGIAACGGGRDKAEDDIWTMDRLYAKAQELGFEGTLDELIDMFKGDKGDKGDDGEDGKDGKDGRGITHVEIDSEGRLVVTYSDGTQETLGKVVGENGQTGATGSQGAQGDKGEDGTNGKDGVTPHIGENGNWWIGETDTGVKAAGTDGKDGQNGTNGKDGVDGIDGKDGEDGKDGKNAYELWLDQGYEGEIDDFFAWLKGEHYHRDVDKDEYCDDCQEHIHHRDDDDDAYCDGCREHYEHRDTDNNCECDICGERLPHSDVNKDGYCDVCRESLYSDLYTIVGTGSGDALWSCNWDPALEREDLTFKAVLDTDGVTELHTLTIDLYEGDEFQIIHDHAWAGQMGFFYVAAESQQYLTSAPGGGDMANISVAEGKSGLYELTVKVAPGQLASIEAELIEAYPEIVALKLLNTDGTTIQPTNYTLSMRDIGRYYRKGATVPALPYVPGDELPDPFLMNFDGWNKDDGSKWEGGTIDADMTLTIHYIEEENEGFIADKEGAEYWIVGDEKNKFVHDGSFTQHNVYTRTRVELHAGDELQFAWEGGTSKYYWINMADLLFTKDGEKATVIQDGFYSIILVVTVDEAKAVTGMVISIERTGSILTGYYLIGTPVERNWTNPAATNPENANNKKLFFTQDKDNANIWTLTLTVTADMVPDSWGHGETSAECKIMCVGVEGDWGVGAASGTAGSNNIVLEAGHTYMITFHSDTKVAEWVKLY